MSVGPLCQRGPASCGACCGLYNRRDLSRRGLAALLTRRTRALAGVPRTRAGFAAAARALAATEEEPLFPSVRICPLLGWLDADETRVGCLAHPLSTGGEDLRDCGVYDTRICQSFECPSHAWLSEGEAETVVAATGDWYLYGLVVTDVPFLRACLAGVAAEAGRAVRRADLDDPRFRAGFQGLLRLKEELAPGSDGLYGAFRPAGGEGSEEGEPVPRAIDYGALDRPRSPHDEILLCAGADPRSGNDLDRLEAEVVRRLRAAARALPGA